MQRFRGEVYLKDGAIRPDDLVDSRHKLSIDSRSWHVLSLDSEGRICACLRYLEHPTDNSFNDLWVSHAALADCPRFGSGFRRAVEAEMLRARQMKLGFGEVGGWAVAEALRGTLECLRVILTSFGLGQLLGGCAGVATATFRHCSAPILRRIGLNPLEWEGTTLPAYYDKRYGCHMEVLRFDTRFPNSKYQESVGELRSALAESPVICRDTVRTDEGVCRGAEWNIPIIPPLQGFMPLSAVPRQPVPAWS